MTGIRAPGGVAICPAEGPQTQSTASYGPTGQVFDFGGASTAQHVQVTANSNVDDLHQHTNGFTISFWIKPDTLGASDTGRIYSKEDTVTGVKRGLHILIRSGTTGRIQADYDGDDGGSGNNVVISNSGTSTIVLNTWQHILVIYDKAGTGFLHMYKNGVEVTYDSQSDDSGSVSFVTDAAITAKIGDAVTGDREFDGKITEFAIWTDLAMSAPQRSSVYNSGVLHDLTQIEASNLAYYVQLNQADTPHDGGVVRDLSSNGKNSTSKNGITLIADVP